MPQITLTKTGDYATGVKVKTQFDMESSEKLFEITGPKTLEWKYQVTAKKLEDHGAEIVDEHVNKVKTYLSQNWRSKFKKDVKTKVVKEMKALEKVYKTKSESAKKDIKDHFSKAASEKAERIISDEFNSFMDDVSSKCIKQMGNKASKLGRATKTVLIGGAIVGVAVVGIAASIASFGTAAVPALSAAGATIAVLSTGGTMYKTYKAARKEFRDAQAKLQKSKGKALEGLEAALADANLLKKKYDKMVLRQNEFTTKIERLGDQIDTLNKVKIDDAKAKKLAEKATKLQKDLDKDVKKLDALVSGDPKHMISALEDAIKKVKDGVDIDERIAAQGRGDNLFGALGHANGLAQGIGGLAA